MREKEYKEEEDEKRLKMRGSEERKRGQSEETG